MALIRWHERRPSGPPWGEQVRVRSVGEREICGDKCDPAIVLFSTCFRSFGIFLTLISDLVEP